MKIKEGYKITKVGDYYVVIAILDDLVNFNKMVTLNSVGAYIWNELSNNNLSKEELINKMLETYDTTLEKVSKDVDNFIAILKKYNLLDEK